MIVLHVARAGGVGSGSAVHGSCVCGEVAEELLFVELVALLWPLRLVLLAACLHLRQQGLQPVDLVPDLRGRILFDAGFFLGCAKKPGGEKLVRWGPADANLEQHDSQTNSIHAHNAFKIQHTANTFTTRKAKLEAYPLVPNFAERLVLRREHTRAMLSAGKPLALEHAVGQKIG